MVDADVIARRLLALREAIDHLERSGAGDVARLANDATLRAATERWLQVAIEACIDVAYHVIAAKEWTPPDTARRAFLMLATKTILDAELAERLAAAVGLRNVLVHDYVAVDLARLAQVVREDLGDLGRFAACIGELLASDTDG